MSICRYWPNLLTKNLEKRLFLLFLLTGAPIQAPKRVQGERIFKFLVSLDLQWKNLDFLKISVLLGNPVSFKASTNLKVQKRRPPVL